MNDATHKAGGLTLAEVKHPYWSMHDKSRSEAPSSEDERRGVLQSLRRIVSASAPMFVETIASDYGCRSSSETLLAEVIPALMMIRGALSNLGAWMRPERRRRSILFWPGRNEVHRQPKGVVLIISTWNSGRAGSRQPIC